MNTGINTWRILKIYRNINSIKNQSSDIQMAVRISEDTREYYNTITV